MRETALKSAHVALGARLVPFAGWNMPVQYGPILDEARTVRTKAGLFDLGHMGRVRIRGRDAEAMLQRLQTNDVSQIQPGRIRYAMILDEQGRTQDDILVYRNPGNDGFFLVINAGNAERDLGIIRACAAGFADAIVEDQTDALGMIAIQGPLSETITQRLTDANLAALKYYAWTRGTFCGVPMEISRTGYTGEDGFEVALPSEAAADFWSALKGAGVAPCGLGARDTLRLEAGMNLYGNDMDETVSPLESGLAWTVVLEAAMLGIAGGGVGALAAHAAIDLAGINFTMEGVSIEVTARPGVTAAGILLAALLGAVAGAAPAWTAARREIVEGLRSA